MSVSNLQKTSPKSVSTKPLSHLQQYLVELKTSIALFRELLLEFKGVLFDLALIAFFVWEMIKLFKNLQG
jgi:hypothetical protein